MLDTLRANLAARWDTVTGLRGFSHELPNPQPPCVFPVLDELAITYDDDMSGGTLVTMTWRLLVTSGDWRAAQKTLIPFLEPSGGVSLRAALDTDNTLSAAVDWCRLVSAGNPGEFKYGESTFIGCDLTVIAAGD